jgi:hypothetical protein
MLVHTIKRATTSRAGGSPPVDVEVEAIDVPPSVHPDMIPMLLNDPGADEAPVSAVRIRGPYPASETADEGTPPDSVVGTEPGTTPTPVSARGSSEYDSITTALLAGRGHPRIFVSLARQLEIYDEDIETSLVQYHPVMDPTREDDPLLLYGAVDGMLPGKMMDETHLLHFAVMRFNLPHRLWNWSFLEEGIKVFSSLRVGMQDLTAYHPEGGGVIYSLNFHILDRIAQLSLAVHQILGVLYDFLETPLSSQFLIAPHWQLLQLMEENLSRSTIILAFSTLQFHLKLPQKPSS